MTICTKDRERILSEIVKDKNGQVGSNLVGVGALDDPNDVGLYVKLTSIGKTVEKYLLSSENINGVEIDEYIIMPDHIHAIILLDPQKYANQASGTSRAPSPTYEMLPHIVSTFKRFCNREIGRNIFQRAYMEHVIRDKEDCEKRRKYIYENPIRWYYNKEKQ